MKKVSSPKKKSKKVLRIRTLNNEIVLATCGSAFKNKGVQAVLDAVIEYLPSPTEVEAIKGVLDDKDETRSVSVMLMIKHFSLLWHLKLLLTRLWAR